MATKFIVFCATVLISQAAYGQIVPCGCGSALGNNLVANNIIPGGGIVVGNAGLGLASPALGLASPALGLASPALGLASPGLNVVNPGLVGIGNVGVIGGVNGASFLNYPDLYNIGSSGPLVVSTISPIGPSGLAVASENVIEGTLLVNGALPFLSAVSFEGALPTAGSGVATCGCGNGAVGILSEGFPGTYPGPFPGPYPGPMRGPVVGGVYY